MRYIYFLAAFLMLQACATPAAPEVWLSHLPFRKPKFMLENEQDTLKPLPTQTKPDSTTHIKEAWNSYFGGYYIFADTVMTCEYHSAYDSTKRLVSTVRTAFYEEPIFKSGQEERAYFDTLKDDSIYIVGDYGAGDYYIDEELKNAYPMYIVNESSSHQRLYWSGTTASYLVQEALHPDGNYYPIERKMWVFCSMGHAYRVMPAKSYAVYFVKYYSGEYKTKLRIRFKNGYDGRVIVSEPYDGSIKMSQFDFKNSAEIEGYLGLHRRNPQYYLDQVAADFVGSLPLQLADYAKTNADK
jgi:hypothetical protein